MLIVSYLMLSTIFLAYAVRLYLGLSLNYLIKLIGRAASPHEPQQMSNG